VFGRLDFVYLPSRDVAADLAQYGERLGAEVVFAVERFGTRVAMIRLGEEPPAILLAEHLEGDAPVLVYRVEDLENAATELREQGAELGSGFGFPAGEGIEVILPGPQRIAIYEETRPDRVAQISGRRDF
jgi:hypothetical protein